MKHIPHVWKTIDDSGSESMHLAMCKTGAEQAHLVHHSIASCNEIKSSDLGPISVNTDRHAICFDPNCTLYGLSFDE